MKLDQIRIAPIEVLVILLLWVGLFRLNEWLFSAFSISQSINWIFLPAALRMTSVLLFGATGSVGLVIGALITSNTDGVLTDAIVLALLSGLCPYLSVALCSRLFKLPKDLGGLNPKQLLGFAIAGGVLSVIPHHLYFYARHQVDYLFQGAGAMLMGDIVGALLLLYLVNLSLRLSDKIRAKATP